MEKHTVWNVTQRNVGSRTTPRTEEETAQNKGEAQSTLLLGLSVHKDNTDSLLRISTVYTWHTVDGLIVIPAV